MQSALATVHDGRVELVAPDDWPEGLQVEIIPVSPSLGINEVDYPTSPAGIAKLLEQMENASGDGVPVEFDFDCTGWDDFQKESVRQSWTDPTQ